ncbi:serine/arginine repetitive matrix protein 2-like [Penaeus monodon]|uniref:serine/arginine repetitive matrix protein 2-like n=1 Tax=Penaeus monodon TaxID=6687 RepID=UPI0018A75687|nr:serine/arginine repetitive matrix protein 2-like [Penaeus monodon]
MLSTPSSSTSSLSSLAPARPISPSGRRTPPGPRMGTAGRLSSSPTPARKAQRPNIKTNPAAAGRRAGSRSPVGAVASSTGPSGAPDGEKLATPPPSPSSVRHQASDPCVKAPASPPPVLRARTTVTPPSPEAARKQSVFPKLVPPSSPPLRASSTFSSHISPPPDARLAQRSVSPPNLAAGGKSRHSIVSMHSLESIPELDSDGHTSAADTLERKGAKVAAGTACGQAASPSSRHSAPETAFPERHVPMGGVTGHKRSTSLTPVHEEKLSHSAKAPQVNLKAQVATAPPRSRADEDFKLASGAPEARTQQEAAKKDAKRAAPEDDKSIQHVRIEGKVAKDTRADLSAGWNRPTSPIETIEASETTTHVVIRIPLRRSASSGVIGEEKRVSIEFLPEQEKGSGRRMRSVSTPREVTREAICDSFRDPKDSIGLARNRSLTGRRESRAEGKKDDSSDNGGRVRVRRRRTRSRSRVSEARTDGSAAPAASSPDPAAGAATAAGSRGRSLSGERSPGQQGRPTVVPAASEDPKAKEAAEGQVRPPPRQRSLSRGPDRRTTRAVTPADVQQANSAQDPTNDEGAPRRRRTQSSSRVPSSTANGTDAAGTGGSQRPSRRRSSSGTRQPATLPSAPKPGDKKEEEQKPAAKESTEEKTTTTASDARETTTAEHKNLPDEGSATGPPRRLEREGSAKGPIKKRSVLIQTHVIKSASRSCQADLEAPEKRALDQCKQELAAQEERYQKQVDQLTISLAEKQQELSRLTQQLEEVKRTYVDPVAMQRKMDEMQLEVREQVGQAESLKVELQYSKNEVELHKMRLQRLEEDLEAAKEKNQSLQTQLAAENKSDRIEELELRLRVMDERLRAGQQDKEKLNKQILEMEAERDEEIKIIQDALDEAAAEREELIATFEKELQNMTTMNSTREQQLMEDFEWMDH